MTDKRGLSRILPLFFVMSIFGMVALSGVVINDAIVLIERINENLAQKMFFFEAITNGGKRRFRAIFLTSVSTVGGLMPLILERARGQVSF